MIDLYEKDPPGLPDTWTLWRHEADEALAGDADAENAIDRLSLWMQAKRFPPHRLRDEPLVANLDAWVAEHGVTTTASLGSHIDPAAWCAACRSLGATIGDPDGMDHEQRGTVLALLTDLDEAGCAIEGGLRLGPVESELTDSLQCAYEVFAQEIALFRICTALALGYLRAWRRDLTRTFAGLARTVMPWHDIAEAGGYRAIPTGPDAPMSASIIAFPTDRLHAMAESRVLAAADSGLRLPAAPQQLRFVGSDGKGVRLRMPVVSGSPIRIEADDRQAEGLMLGGSAWSLEDGRGTIPCKELADAIDCCGGLPPVELMRDGKRMACGLDAR